MGPGKTSWLRSSRVRRHSDRISADEGENDSSLEFGVTPPDCSIQFGEAALENRTGTKHRSTQTNCRGGDGDSGPAQDSHTITDARMDDASSICSAVTSALTLRRKVPPESALPMARWMVGAQ